MLCPRRKKQPEIDVFRYTARKALCAATSKSRRGSLGLASARYLRELESFLDMLAQFNLVGGSTHMVDNYFLPNNE